MVAISGWARGTWSQGTWGESLPVVVTGVAGTGGGGPVSVGAGANVSDTGVGGTRCVGSGSVFGAGHTTGTGST